jgi:hypothetical protein
MRHQYSAGMQNSLSAAELEQLVKLGKRSFRADLETRRAIQRQGVTIVPANFYSEIPTVDEFDASFEFKEKAPYLTLFDDTATKENLSVLGRYADEFDPPAEGDREAPSEYFWNNPAFSFSDAMAYYCILRHVRPKRVLEIGSGFSTLVAKAAIAKNGVGEITCIEPFPMAWFAELEGIDLIRKPVQQIGADWFNEYLGNGDVLFIDSTHTVKAGSDCLHLYLRVLPGLRHDLTVHAHDIYLPFPMPKKDFERNIYWTEQYLLAAYLMDNPRAKIIYGSRYNHVFNPDALAALMHGRWKPGGASIWFTLAAR